MDHGPFHCGSNRVESLTTFLSISSGWLVNGAIVSFLPLTLTITIPPWTSFLSWGCSRIIERLSKLSALFRRQNMKQCPTRGKIHELIKMYPIMTHVHCHRFRSSFSPSSAASCLPLSRAYSSPTFKSFLMPLLSPAVRSYCCWVIWWATTWFRGRTRV